MIHQGERLSLGLKAGDDVFGVHAEFDNLDGNLATDRFLLLRQVNDTATPFANLLQQFVTADSISGLLKG
jgi:hypothetical protein